MLYLLYPIYTATKKADKQLESNVVFEQHPVNPTMHILVVGDSSAAGVGALDPKESIAGRLGQHYPNADLVNAGFSGAKVKDLIGVLQKQKGKHYDLILIQIGGNDITHFVAVDDIKKDIEEVLTLANQLSDRTILLTSGDIGKIPIFHWPLNTIMTSRTKQVRQIFMDAIAKHKNMSYIDLFYLLKKDPKLKDFSPYYSPDSFHLSGAGYGVYYFYLERALKD